MTEEELAAIQEEYDRLDFEKGCGPGKDMCGYYVYPEWCEYHDVRSVVEHVPVLLAEVERLKELLNAG